MLTGTVASIYITTESSKEMISIPEVRAVAGKGLEGDRYFTRKGFFSHKPGPDREVTLIESEAIEALERDHGISFGLGDSRRNIVTRGVPLNDLVGREFRVGDVTLRGMRLCVPCDHLEKLTQPGVKQALVNRGGLRAQILTDGIIRVEDTIQEQ